MRIATFLLACLSVTRVTSADDYALIIGVNHCPQFVLSGGSKPRPLRAAESDSDGFADLLVSKFGFERDNIVTLKGPKASLSAVRESFERLTRQLKKTDRFVFYFSGHGTQIPDQKPFEEDDDLDEALCLHDSEATGNRLLVDDELGRLLEDLPASQVTILLDCCHAGTGHKELDDDIQSRYLPCPIDRDSQIGATPWQDLRGHQKSFGKQTCAFFACQPAEQAYERRLPGTKENESVRAGQFSHVLKRGLETGEADLNRDGQISQDEVRKYIEQNLNETFNKLRQVKADQQHPSLDSLRPETAVFFRHE